MWSGEAEADGSMPSVCEQHVERVVEAEAESEQRLFLVTLVDSAPEGLGCAFSVLHAHNSPEL